MKSRRDWKNNIYGFDNMALSLMTNYFSDISMIVKMNDKMSSRSKIE